MQIKIEVDVKPEELRRFLGLPDVAGLQDDIVQFLRSKVGQVNENFNPGDFLRGNLDLIRQSPAWRKIMTRMNLTEDGEEGHEEESTPRRRSRRSPKPSEE